MKKVSTKAKVAVGVGLGLMALATGAGYYFYGSKSAGANRKKVAKWANDFKGDVIKKAKKLKKLDEKAFRTIVDEAQKAYRSMQSIDKRDLELAASELKQNWDKIEREIARSTKAGVREVKKAVKKSVAKKKAVVSGKKKVVAKKHS